MKLRFIRHPLYNTAHPGEDRPRDERCERCVIAERPDNRKLVMLWSAYDGAHYSVNRNDPRYPEHRALRNIEVVL